MTVHKKDARQISKSHSPTSVPPEEQGTHPAEELLAHQAAAPFLADVPQPIHTRVLLCVHDLPQERSGSAGLRTTGATEPSLSNGASPGKQCHAPQPKDLQGNLSPRRSSPTLCKLSIKRAVKINILHLLSQNRTGALPCW